MTSTIRASFGSGFRSRPSSAAVKYVSLSTPLILTFFKHKEAGDHVD